MLDDFGTVPALFHYIRQQIKKGPSKLLVKYDEKLGFPQSLELEPDANVSDNYYMFEISSFQAK